MRESVNATEEMGETINCARGATGECASDSYCDDIPTTNALVTI